MACRNVCKLCDRLVISSAVIFSDGTLNINLPAGAYADGEKYCIVVAQTIPDTATITAPVVVTVGDGTAQYPLVRSDCSQVTAAALRTRTRYATRVSTNANGGVFKMLGHGCSTPDNTLAALDGTAQGGETT